jgi:hypothetical protein
LLTSPESTSAACPAERSIVKFVATLGPLTILCCLLRSTGSLSSGQHSQHSSRSSHHSHDSHIPASYMMPAGASSAHLVSWVLSGLSSDRSHIPWVTSGLSSIGVESDLMGDKRLSSIGVGSDLMGHKRWTCHMLLDGGRSIELMVLVIRRWSGLARRRFARWIGSASGRESGPGSPRLPREWPLPLKSVNPARTNVYRTKLSRCQISDTRLYVMARTALQCSTDIPCPK